MIAAPVDDVGINVYRPNVYVASLYGSVPYAVNCRCRALSVRCNAHRTKCTNSRYEIHL